MQDYFRKFVFGEYNWKIVMLRLVITVILTFTVCKMTTFGWRGSGSLSKRILPRDKELPQRLKTHVIKFSDTIGDRSVFQYPQLNKATDYISEEFKKLGLSIEFQEYQVLGKTVRNIIARKLGKENPDEIIVVGAHYDTCFNVGANDNASGVAVLLELARIIANRQYSRTIELVAFTNEEPPFYKTNQMGSFVYASNAKKDNKNIKVAIILETIGYYSDKSFSQRYPLFLGAFYPNRANFIAVVGNLSVRNWVNKIAKGLKEHNFPNVWSIALFNFIQGVDFSDHWSFWQAGFPAVMLTDTAFYRYPYYHTNSDTFEKLDYNNLALLTEALVGVLSD